MSVPGSNLLMTALSVLGSTKVNYFEFNNRSLNSAGVYVTTYNTPVSYSIGSVQPVKKNKYEAMGLDFEKSYFAWYIPNVDATDVLRNSSGDVIETLGRRLQLVGSDNWFGIDGWKSLIGIDIGAATGSLYGN